MRILFIRLFILQVLFTAPSLYANKTKKIPMYTKGFPLTVGPFKFETLRPEFQYWIKSAPGTKLAIFSGKPGDPEGTWAYCSVPDGTQAKVISKVPNHGSKQSYFVSYEGTGVCGGSIGFIPAKNVIEQDQEKDTLTDADRAIQLPGAEDTASPTVGEENCPPEKGEGYAKEDAADLNSLLNDDAFELGAKIKTPQEVEKYFACYPTKNYKKHYGDFSKMLDSVSIAYGIPHTKYGIPKAAIGCLLLRESQWDGQNTSHTGAAGAGQHIAQNREHINEILGRPTARKKWDAYFDGLPPKLSNQCRRNTFATKTDAYCTVASVGATAVYLDEIQGEFERCGNIQNATQKQLNALYLIMGTGHNAGTGSICRMLGNSTDPDNWIAETLLAVRFYTLKKLREKYPGPKNADLRSEKLKKRITEVRRHIETLQNCLEPGNTKPPMGSLDNSKCFN